MVTSFMISMALKMAAAVAFAAVSGFGTIHARVSNTRVLPQRFVGLQIARSGECANA
jgi:hypothetical protein